MGLLRTGGRLRQSSRRLVEVRSRSACGAVSLINTAVVAKATGAVDGVSDPFSIAPQHRDTTGVFNHKSLLPLPGDISKFLADFIED